ncbi:MAG: Rho termination factor N-terminal domain-containing protein, partial [Treponema sp.]|nr:Rho termination factor N-terminal domain-containing protein [Treponema sp.]
MNSNNGMDVEASIMEESPDENMVQDSPNDGEALSLGIAAEGSELCGGEDAPAETEKTGRVVVRARVKRPSADARESKAANGAVNGEEPLADSGDSSQKTARPRHAARIAQNRGAESMVPPLSDAPASQFSQPIPKLPSMPDLYGKPEPRNEDTSKPRLCINELIRLNMMDLREIASHYGILHDALVNLKKQEVIFTLLKSHTDRGGVIYAYGSLEILPDSYGFLRSPQNSYLPGPDDIYISPSQIRLFALKTGDTVYGQIRSPKESERFFAMLHVETVNYDSPTVAQNRIPFDNLTPLYPNKKLDL